MCNIISLMEEVQKSKRKDFHPTYPHKHRMKEQAIRDLMFELIDKGKTKSEVAEVLGITRNTVHKWLRTGNVKLTPRGPRIGKRKLSVEQESDVIAHVDSSPGITQAGLAQYI